jgi:hypothetical protein
MKKHHYTKSLLYALCLAAMSMGICACSKEDSAKDAAPRLKVDKIRVTVIQTGRLSSGSKASLNVLANLGYEITCDVPWINPDKPVGKGITDIMLDIGENATGDDRVGHLTVSTKGLSEVVTVMQTMDPDTDDGQDIGYVYFEDDMGWCEQHGGADEIENQATGTTISISSNAAAKADFTSRGYEDINPGGNCFYLAKHYFKMGKTNYQTGIRRSIPNIANGKTTNARLTFSATPVRTGSGNFDKVFVVVEIEGPGTVGAGSKKASDPINIQIPDGGVWYWVDKSIDLYGISPQTKIILKTQMSGGETGTFRWCLNNIKCEKINAN